MKCGSQSTLKEFRCLLQSVIDDDRKHDHLPGYGFTLVGEMVEMRPKAALEPQRAQRLSDYAYEEGRRLAPGWDIYGLEQEWLEWMLKKKQIVPRSRDAHFLAFCKRRGRYPGFT